jgi:ribosomal 30S subunit maturation factor RimM
LVGLDVWDVSGRHHGRVVDVLEYPGQTVFRALDGDRELLIPATQAAVREISLNDRRMLVDLPEAEDV